MLEAQREERAEYARLVNERKWQQECERKMREYQLGLSASRAEERARSRARSEASPDGRPRRGGPRAATDASPASSTASSGARSERPHRERGAP